MLRSSKREDGFALVEALVAILLLAIVAVAVGRFMTGATRGHLSQQEASKFSSAAEEAWELALATKPWHTNTACTGGGCTLPVSQTSGLNMRATLTADGYAEVNGSPTSYHLKLKVEQLNTLSGSPTSVKPIVIAGDVDDSRAIDVGQVRITDCRVNQVDDRQWPGSCANKRTIEMVQPKLGTKKFPGFPMPYNINPQRQQWNNAVAMGATRVIYTPIPFTVDLKSVDLDGYSGADDGMINIKGQPGSYFTQKDSAGRPLLNLPAGKYQVDIHDDYATDPDWRLWGEKSVPYGIKVEEPFTIRISEGVETQIAKFYQPQYVAVTLYTRQFAGELQWKPHWAHRAAYDPDNVRRLRVMLIPFPQGRAIIPGVHDGNNVIDRSIWPNVVDGDKTVRFTNIRPGLYLASYYYYYCETNTTDCSNEKNWLLKTYPIVKTGLGLGPNGRWDEGNDPPFDSETSRLPYFYVNRNGSLASMNTATVMLPGCRGDVRSEVEERARNHKNANGTFKWYYDPLGGWIRLTDLVKGGMRAPVDGWSEFRFAKGGWSAVEPGTRVPLVANRYKTIFRLTDDCTKPEVDVYSGGDEST
jgi:type II secretory pathway pseudopilin PulG